MGEVEFLWPHWPLQRTLTAFAPLRGKTLGVTHSKSCFPAGACITITHKHQGEKAVWEKKPASRPFHLPP